MWYIVASWGKNVNHKMKYLFRSAIDIENYCMLLCRLVSIDYFCSHVNYEHITCSYICQVNTSARSGRVL